MFVFFTEIIVQMHAYYLFSETLPVEIVVKMRVAMPYVKTDYGIIGRVEHVLEIPFYLIIFERNRDFGVFCRRKQPYKAINADFVRSGRVRFTRQVQNNLVHTRFFDVFDVADITVDHFVARLAFRPEIVYAIVTQVSKRHKKSVVATEFYLFFATYRNAALARFIPLNESAVEARFFYRFCGLIYGNVFIAVLQTLYEFSHFRYSIEPCQNAPRRRDYPVVAGRQIDFIRLKFFSRRKFRLPKRAKASA